MRLIEVFQMNEEKIMATLRNGQNFPIYKNPTPAEMEQIGLNGVIKGILTPTNFIGFDFKNVNLRDLPPILGYPIIIYTKNSNKVTIELFHNINLAKEQFEQLVTTNPYLKKFDIEDIIWHNNET